MENQQVLSQQQETADGSKQQISWAKVLSKNMSVNSNKKNVLEIVLEKDERGAFAVTQEECVKLMRKIGMDTRPGIHVDEIQICPNGRGVIFVTLRKEIQIEQFCRYDVHEVTKSGIRAINMKPVNRTEVIVNIRNLHPNTKNEVVMNYLAKFGKVVTNKVVYGVYGEGPLKGFRNGNRSYKMELGPLRNLGTYHVIDGQKVTIKYPGQMQTCARCHQTARTCKGRGLAKLCEERNGEKVDFVDYILSLWKDIGYSPESEFDLEELSDEEEFAIVEEDGGQFTPTKKPDPETDPDMYNGVCIRSFPPGTDKCNVIELLMASGLPEEYVDEVSFKSKGCVIIQHIPVSLCNELIKALHNTQHYGKKIYCNGLIPYTPEKKGPLLEETDHPLPEINLNGKPLENPTESENTSSSSLTTLGTSSDITKFVEDNAEQLDDTNFIRKHSLSLRSPPKGSIAAEVLERRSSLDKAQNLLTEVRKMSTLLTEYESCISTDDEDKQKSDENVADHNEPKSMNEKSRQYRQKRKNRTTPTKESFIKRPNLEAQI